MIVLTGGAGFIGSCFLWKLNSEGIDDVIVVDDLDDTDKWKNLSGKKFKEYIQKDEFIRMVEAGKIKKPEHIIHMGACSSTTCTDGEYLIKNNYEYSKVLAKWAVEKKASYIYASSAATYGAGGEGYDDDPQKIISLRPLNMYGYSKQLFDLWIMRNCLADKVTGLKFFNVFGPNEYHKGEMMSVVCKKFNEVKNGNIALFKSYKNEYADGEQKRDFIYIKDAVRIMYELLCHPDRTGIFNLGTGKARSWNDLARAMFSSMGKQPDIKYVDMPEELRTRYQYFTQAKMDRLKNTGCDTTCLSLEEAVADYGDYLREGARL